MSEEMNYRFWMVWGNTCEGNRRWHMVRTPDTWDVAQVRERAQSYAIGGCGDDFCEIVDIQEGYDNGFCTYYYEEEN